MKFDIASDLHLDHYGDFGKAILKYWAPGADCLVLAGDLMDGASDRVSERTDTLKFFCSVYKYVFMVMGNHDYYGNSFAGVVKQNQEYSEMFQNLIILEPGTNYIHQETGLKIAGGTLWYPDSDMVQLLKNYWPDFQFIKRDGARPHDIFKDNAWFRNQFVDLNNPYKPDIIVSHMVPTPLAIHPKYADSDYNCFFVSDETELIKKLQPKLWVFGHTHYPFDFKIGETRLYCNPGTYPNENTNPDFKKRITIEL